uniref:Leucine-rich repeat-containing N-terminal plant-type domain-containing protein n=1 Tax=Aegilops tauschii subsp. strangulata TaxID=200361 RepID=A0A453NCQ7_AEGTS
MQTLQFLNKTHMPSFALSLVLLISLSSLTSSCTEHERGPLLQFLAELSQDGGLAASWQNDTDCCKWEGITCRSPDRAVTDVSLASRGLEGSISPFLGNLTSLLRLNLSCNSLSGGLPLELVSSSSITILDVSFNQLNGTLHELPSSTPSRPLQVLNISSNLFAGHFPSTTWKVMEKLVTLNASNNSFTGGSIPPSLGNCSRLRELGAGYNNLSGVIPNELFNATSLEYLSFPNNDLHGAIDGTDITNLRNLVTLDLGRNSFSGKIPVSIGQLKKLEELRLDNNNMSGELPSALSNCTNLITIDLKSNNFSGELTKVNFSLLPNLRTLDVFLNNFSGKVPESLYSCSNLTALRLAGNNLSGQLSPQIGNLKYLTFMSLTDNSFKNITNALHILKRCKNLTTLLIALNFRGEIMPKDDKIDGFENLQVLGIGGCELSGQIPHWISKLGNLQILVLADNRLNGSIPVWIKTLSNLFYLDISNNSFTGRIPTAIMDMPMLKSEKSKAHLDPRVFELPVYSSPSRQYRVPTALPKVLDLSKNKFTGVIPLEIGQMKALLSLNFSFNHLTGHIPQSICNLTKLQVLDLSANNLTVQLQPL